MDKGGTGDFSSLFLTAIFISYWHLMLETEHRIRNKKLNISTTMNKTEQYHI